MQPLKKLLALSQTRQYRAHPLRDVRVEISPRSPTTMSAPRRHIADYRNAAQPMRDAGSFALCACEGRDTID